MNVQRRNVSALDFGNACVNLETQFCQLMTLNVRCFTQLPIQLPAFLRREFLRGAEENGKVVKRGVRQIRGEQACADLEAMVLKVWQARR